MRPFRSFGRGDGMDEYLMSEGLWRKTVPKDETSLYRAVAEQVCRPSRRPNFNERAHRPLRSLGLCLKFRFIYIIAYIV